MRPMVRLLALAAVVWIVAATRVAEAQHIVGLIATTTPGEGQGTGTYIVLTVARATAGASPVFLVNGTMNPLNVRGASLMEHPVPGTPLTRWHVTVPWGILKQKDILTATYGGHSKTVTCSHGSSRSLSCY